MPVAESERAPSGALSDCIATSGCSAVVLEGKPDSFEAFGAGHHFHVDALAFRQFINAFAGKHGTMDEDILAAIHRHEAEALLRIVPFDLAFDFLGGTGRPLEGPWRSAAEPRTTTATTTTTTRGLGRAGVDGGDLGDLRALRPLSHPDRQRGPRFKRGMPGRLGDTDVQQCLAGPVGQFDESESLLAIEPFHFSLPFRTCRYRPRRLSRRSVEGPRRRASK